ncbi:MAG: BatA and WFA domain-containing protein [Bacteroidota bacterium]|nr:BatA and WFA domain-containing protein [Bacteroidota bacterium]
MLFLNPSILFGLLAASIPILIHLLNLRKLKKIDFSTLTFLKELQKNKVRKIRIRQWLLLALRVLIIIFLVMAFSRPALKGTAIFGTTSAAKTSAVFIFDDTYSMSLVNEKGSYLNQAKAAARNIINNLQDGDEAAIVLVSEMKNEQVFSSDLKNIKQKIDGIKPAFISSNINRSIVSAARLLNDSKNFNKEIYLFTDLQDNSLPKKDEISNLSELLDSRTKLYAFRFPPKEVFNLSIDKISINNQIFEKNKTIGIDVLVTNHSINQAENRVVSVFMNEERTGQKTVTLKAGESKTITIDATLKGSGFTSISAQLEDDDIAYDNIRYTAINIPEEIPLIIFASTPADAEYINLVLSASGETGTIKVQQKSFNQIASVDVNQFNAIIIIGSESTNSFDRINKYVQNGGGVFVMPGAGSNLSGMQSVCGALGITKPTSLEGGAAGSGSKVLFDKVEYRHPIFNNIFAGEQNRAFDSPEIYRFFKIKGGGQNIISLQNGNSFLTEYKSGKGKIIFMASSPELTSGNFPVKAIFPPLINKIITYLSSKNADNTEYFTGTELQVNTEQVYSNQIHIIKPDKAEEYLQLTKDQKYLTYNNSDAAGIYKILSGGRTVSYIPVNFNPQESSSKYLQEKELLAYLKDINFKGIYTSIDPKNDPAKLILQARFGSELWKMFVVLALLAALVEMAIARTAKKEL